MLEICNSEKIHIIKAIAVIIRVLVTAESRQLLKMDQISDRGALTIHYCGSYTARTNWFQFKPFSFIYRLRC